MDRITESFLNEFIAEHELEALAPSEQFEHLAAFVTVRRHYVSETFSPTEIHTGGGGDTGIDAIAILVNGALVTDVETLNDHADISGHFDVTFVFIQAYRSNSFDGKKVSDFGFGVKDFFEQKPRLARNQHITNAAEVMEALYHQGTKFRPGNPACRLYFVTTGTWANDHDLDARRCSVEKDLRSLQIFRDVKFMCVDAQTLQKFYRETKNAIVKEFTFTNRLIIPEVSGVNEANVGFVPLSGFLSIVTNESGDLLSVFDKNVRDWQEYVAPVNDEIRATLISDHKDRFVLMNNGVTIVARTLRTVRRDRIQIEDFQIVNGCQTTHVLYDQREKADPSVYIPLRVIATQDEDVVRSISRGTNRQTKVDDDQFFALTEFAVQIEEYFRTFPDAHRVYYERRSGQYSRSSVQNTRIVTHRNLVRSMGAMFLSSPDEATRRYKVLRGRVGKDILARGHRLEPCYVAAFAWYKLDVNFRTRRIDPKFKVARLHILLVMKSLANPDPQPNMGVSKMEGYCDKINKILWDPSKADDLCARAASLVEKVAEGRFERDTIRTQAFTERVIAQCRKTG